VHDQPDLANQLRLAHQARRAAEHQLDDIRRALCDTGVIRVDDPYGNADLADVIRQAWPGQPSAPRPDDPDWNSPEDAVYDRDAQSGVDTPDCDCGHDGMGPGWHARDCEWMSVPPCDHCGTRGHSFEDCPAGGGDAPDDELTAEEARALMDELVLDLYRAQDALAFLAAYRVGAGSVAPDDGLRAQLVAAITSAAIRIKPDSAGIVDAMLRTGSSIHLTEEEAAPLADAVMTVRDRRLEQLTAERDGWKADAHREAGNVEYWRARAERAEATIARVRQLAAQYPVTIDTAHLEAALGQPGTCTARLGPVHCTQPAGHYQPTRHPGDGDDIGGWHAGPPAPRDHRTLWTDDDPDAISHRGENR
jgi:hypothetical protein